MEGVGEAFESALRFLVALAFVGGCGSGCVVGFLLDRLFGG